ncbi:hypothetical protein GRF61_23465 [Azoarcus sp. TTM-91]|uniref:cytochrome C oxidase subunit IV family protein n=1 Tax=Azoarcus sp. TTM-91 TaxID=2691581 RepID=UPI00145DE52F|nr:cytochrome C oxidase subunit IV family protein [Azoarcus sp. TTM-91]NMG37419.1 hypothetical protein [Azoarcus sp. TTM-91]
MSHASHAIADRRSTLLWLALLAATALTWAIGEGHASGPAIAALLLAVAMAKGTVVILDFMALARAPLLWRIALLGWLALVCALIGLAYWKGMP